MSAHITGRECSAACCAGRDPYVDFEIIVKVRVHEDLADFGRPIKPDSVISSIMEEIGDLATGDLVIITPSLKIES
jgi:hypothetical protein